MILGPLWKWIGGGLLFLTLILGIALQVEKRHSRKLSERNTVLTQKLDELAKRSKETQAQTKQVITRYQKITVPKVEERVRIVEKAPLPGQCRTPAEVMRAEI